MASKFRPLYDKLYMGIDTKLLALGAKKDARNRAKAITINSSFNKEYNEIVKPYWKKYRISPDKNWVKIYNANNEHLDPRYIPDDIWFDKIIPHFNFLLFAQALQDKNLHNLYLPNVKRPTTIVKNISGLYCDDKLGYITMEEAIEKVLKSDRFLIKPAVGSGKGKDINFYTGKNLSKEDVINIFNKYGKNFIIQEKVQQHPEMSKIYDNSLNTIRLVTFRYKGEVQIMSIIVRMGSGSSEIDNVSQGGYACKINADGSFDKLAVNRKGEWVDRHPSGTVFEGLKIPCFEKLIDTVKKSAIALPHFSIVGWDFAIDSEGDPIMIEYNVIPGQNQKTWGPTFGDMTEEILDEVFLSEGE